MRRSWPREKRPTGGASRGALGSMHSALLAYHGTSLLPLSFKLPLHGPTNQHHNRLGPKLPRPGVVDAVCQGRVGAAEVNASEATIQPRPQLLNLLRGGLDQQPLHGSARHEPGTEHGAAREEPSSQITTQAIPQRPRSNPTSYPSPRAAKMRTAALLQAFLSASLAFALTAPRRTDLPAITTTRPATRPPISASMPARQGPGRPAPDSLQACAPSPSGESPVRRWVPQSSTSSGRSRGV